MSDDGGGGKKDYWDKLKIISGILASILVPLAIGLTGHWVTSAYQKQESNLKDREFARKWIEISLDILRAKDEGDQKNLRAWAINVINHYVENDAIKISAELREDLETNKSNVPPPSITTQAQVQAMVPSDNQTRIDQVTAQESVALRHLIDKDITQAVAAMQVAYDAWPDFRTVDEMLKLMKKHAPDLTAPENPGWKALYREIAEKMDMRGIDPLTIETIKQQAQGN